MLDCNSLNQIVRTENKQQLVVNRHSVIISPFTEMEYKWCCGKVKHTYLLALARLEGPPLRVGVWSVHWGLFAMVTKGFLFVRVGSGSPTSAFMTTFVLNWYFITDCKELPMLLLNYNQDNTSKGHLRNSRTNLKRSSADKLKRQAKTKHNRHNLPSTYLLMYWTWKNTKYFKHKEKNMYIRFKSFKYSTKDRLYIPKKQLWNQVILYNFK